MGSGSREMGEKGRTIEGDGGGGRNGKFEHVVVGRQGGERKGREGEQFVLLTFVAVRCVGDSSLLFFDG